MALIKSADDIEKLRVAGKHLAEIFRDIKRATRAGVSTGELDVLVNQLVREKGDKPALLGYQPYGADYPFPATICIAINDEAVHGIPKQDRILQEGDIVGFDLVIEHEGVFVDMAATFPVGDISAQAANLIKATAEGLRAGIAQCRAGNRIGDLGYAIESVAKAHNVRVVEELGGHGVGHKVHEEPYIPNYGIAGKGQLLKPGMVLALEPIFNEGKKEVFLDRDGYTYKTSDGKLSAHFEHTILITEGEPETLTIL